MSIYSGKCDVWDTFIDIDKMNDESDWSKVRIYHKGEALKIKSVKDLLPYASHLISFGSWHDGECYTRITDVSYIDRSEKESLDRALKYFKSEYRKCRRKKQEFIPENAEKKYSGFFRESYLLELAQRVKEHPCVANTDGLHTPFHEMQRKELRDTMIEFGYTKEQADKWVFEGIKTW